MHDEDERLVLAARDGDRDAFAALVVRHLDAVCAVTFAWTGNRGDSEDLAQEALLSAWRALPRLRRPSRFRGFVLTVARNLGRDARRRRQRRPVGDVQAVADAEAAADERLAAAQLSARVWEALDALPARYREPLILYYREGRSSQAVAAQLDLRVGTVQRRLSRGRAMLRGELEETLGRSARATRPDRRLAGLVAAALPRAPGLAAKGSTARGPVGSTTSTGLVAAGLAAAAVGLWWFALAGPATASPPVQPVDDPVPVHEARERVGPPPIRRTEAPMGGAAAEDAVVLRPAPAYVLTARDDGTFAVALRGGLSDSQTQPCRDAIPRERPVTGRVVDARGRPVGNAVVLADSFLGSVFDGSIVAASGDTTDADGRFSVRVASDRDVRLLALHRRGWSEAETVLAGAGPETRELVLGPAAALAGSVTRDGAPVAADVWVTSLDGGSVALRFSTDADGRLEVPELFAGPARVQAQWPMFAREGVGPTASVEVDLRRDGPTEVALDLPTGSTIAVRPRLPARSQTAMHTLVAGDLAVANAEELAQLRVDAAVDDVRHATRDPSEPSVTYFDVLPGAYTVCVEAEGSERRPLGLACTTVDVDASSDGVAVALEVSS